MLLKILTGLLIVMFPVGLAIMLTDFGSDYLWTTTIFLGLQALILFLVILSSIGISRSILLVSLFLIISFLIELIGVRTGFPFGSYTYSRILAPLIVGVPAAIAFAWFSVAVSSYLLTASMFTKMGAAVVCFIASVLILTSDILLEPFASFINGFWIWDSGIIPFGNFVAWLILGFLFCMLISIFIPAERVSATGPFHKKIPFIIFGLNILNFLTLNLIYGYILLSIIAVVLLAWVLILLPLAIKNEA